MLSLMEDIDRSQKRRWTPLLVGVGALVAWFLMAGTASAHGTAAIEAGAGPKVVEIQVTVPHAETTPLEIRVLAPRGNGDGRYLFQRCTFSPSHNRGATCLFEVGPGTAADGRPGRWTAIAVSGRRTLASTTFTVLEGPPST